MLECCSEGNVETKQSRSSLSSGFFTFVLCEHERCSFLDILY